MSPDHVRRMVAGWQVAEEQERADRRQAGPDPAAEAETDLRSANEQRELLLQQAGALSRDESLPLLRKKIYRTRRRPEVGDASSD